MLKVLGETGTYSVAASRVVMSVVLLTQLEICAPADKQTIIMTIRTSKLIDMKKMC